MMTMAVWTITNPIRAHRTRKWMVRAPCLPPNSRAYQGKRAITDGDIAAPVRICSGARMNTTPK